MDDGGDPSRLAANIEQITNGNNSNFLGLMFAIDTPSSILIKSLIDPTTPFVGPISGHSSIRTPFQSNILNLRPSNQDEIYSLVVTLRNLYYVHSFAFFYVTDDADSLEALSYLQNYLRNLSSSLSCTVNVSSPDPDSINTAVNTILSSKSQAVIYWHSSYQPRIIQSFLYAAKAMFPSKSFLQLNNNRPLCIKFCRY